MKKLILALIVTTIGSIISAATVSWGAGWSTTPSIGALTGTMYLLQATGETIPSIDDIANTLRTSGIPSDTTGSSIQEIGKESITSSTGEANLSTVFGTGALASEVNFFVLVITEDSFLISDYKSATNMGLDFYVVPFAAGGENKADWTFDKLGSTSPVDPNVPEPTALALLALGVAGVALRRRIR